MHRRLPRSDLAVPAALSRLMLSDEALRLGDEVDRRAGAVGPVSSVPVEVTGSSADLTDSYYHFFSERLAAWFSLDYVATGEEISRLLGRPCVEHYDDEVQGFVAAEASHSYVACFRGLPLGWSWSLFFCNDAISSCMKVALASCGLRTTLVADKAHPVIASSRQPCAAPYVGNMNPLILQELYGRGFALRDFEKGVSLFNSSTARFARFGIRPSAAGASSDHCSSCWSKAGPTVECSRW